MTRKFAFGIIFGVVLLSLGSVALIQKLKFSYDFEAFFPQNDPETDFYIKLRDSFETDNDFFIVALENQGSVFEKSFLQKVDSLTRRLSQLDNVTAAVGPTQLKRIVRDPVMGQIMEVPLLRWESPEFYSVDSVELGNSNELTGWFFAEDYHSVAINLRHTEKLSKAGCDQLSAEIESLVASFDFPKTHVIGRALGQKLYVELMIHELFLFISLSLVLTTLFL